MRCQPVSLILNRFISGSGTNNRDSFRSQKHWSRKLMANALYCRNGHFNGYAPDPNPSYGYDRSLYYWQVEQVQEELKRLAFCPTCGVDNINGCLHCEITIESDPELHPDRPAYCGACGKPFPWTETALATAREYTDELEELSAEDRTTLKA